MPNGPAFVSRSGWVCPLNSTTLIDKNAVLDKSGSFAYLLCRKERFEYLLLLLLAYTSPGIGDRKPRVLPRCYVWVTVNTSLLDGDILGRDSKDATSRHCISGIYTKVHQNLTNLIRVGLNYPE